MAGSDLSEDGPNVPRPAKAPKTPRKRTLKECVSPFFASRSTSGGSDKREDESGTFVTPRLRTFSPDAGADFDWLSESPVCPEDPDDQPSTLCSGLPLAETPSPKKRRQLTSPFFSPPASPTKTPTLTPRPSRRGLVSCLPVPPLDSARFGLVQEQLADEPLWLLISLVLLTRVAGRVSLPVFWDIRRDYAHAPSALLTEAAGVDLETRMRHLGMASVRCHAIRRLVRRWLDQPPQPGVVTVVKNYPEAVKNYPEAAQDTAWEIGHITQGAYAVDSWRIFCRDKLLGTSAGSDEAQPEWMRVLPQDKELRAFLRWRWMQEGWDWDPLTGDREVLGEALRRAVDERRVGYDDQGVLRIRRGVERAE